jgi:hypothetical protein
MVASVFDLPTVPIMPIGIGTDPVQRSTGRLPIAQPQQTAGAPRHIEPSPPADQPGGTSTGFGQVRGGGFGSPGSGGAAAQTGTHRAGTSQFDTGGSGGAAPGSGSALADERGTARLRAQHGSGRTAQGLGARREPGGAHAGSGEQGSVRPGVEQGPGGRAAAGEPGSGPPPTSTPPPILPALPILPPLEPAHPVSASPVFHSSHPDDMPVSADPSVRISAADITAAGISAADSTAADSTAAGNVPADGPRHGVAGDTDRSVLASLGITSGSASGGGRRRAKDDESDENPTARTPRPRPADDTLTPRTVSFDDFGHLDPLPPAELATFDPIPPAEPAASLPGDASGAPPRRTTHGRQTGDPLTPPRSAAAPFGAAAPEHRGADSFGGAGSADPFGGAGPAAPRQPAEDPFGRNAGVPGPAQPVADSFGGALRPRADQHQPAADSFGESPTPAGGPRQPADPFSSDRGLLPEHERMAADPFGDWAPLRRDSTPEPGPTTPQPTTSPPAPNPPPDTPAATRTGGKRRRSVQLADLLTEALMAYQDAQDSNDARTGLSAGDPALPGPTSLPTPLVELDPAVGDEPGYPGPARHRGDPNW